MNSVSTRNRWQFWGLILSVFLILMTPLGDEPVSNIGLGNTAAVALVLLGLACGEFAQHYNLTDVIQLVLGFWLAYSPYLLGYWSKATMTSWHQLVALGLVALALFSILYNSVRGRFW